MTTSSKWIAAALLGLANVAWAAPTAAPGFLVRTIPTPDVVQGGVARRDNVILVGQGAFGPGGQSIVRLDGGTATTIATGFGGLGGFDLAADGTLYVTDNCFDGDFGCDGATTGDTVYAIPDALTRTTAIAAADAEVLPAGSIPFAFDVLHAGGVLLVTDAVGPGAGRVLEIDGGDTSDLVTGLGYASGIALDGSNLVVGDANEFFVGSVVRYDLDGAPLGPVAGGLSGAFGVDVDAAGDVLVTGGFTDDFSSSTLVGIAGGVASARATGFGFSAGLGYDAPRDAALVLDFGVSEIAAICRDADADGLCDADCAAPTALESAKVTFGNLLAPAGDDKIALKATLVVDGEAVVDPVTTGLTVLADDAEGRVVLDVAVPGGAFTKATRTGWKANDTLSAWAYKNPSGTAGITSVKVKRAPASPETVKIVVKGKKRGTFAAAIAATAPLDVALALDAATCGTAPLSTCLAAKEGSIFKCK
jgi:hypothetical protein